MKRLGIVVGLFLLSFMVNAQYADDALRFSQVYYQGTARSMALAGSMGAIGADFLSASTNPAGMGLYRSGVYSISPEVSTTMASSVYNGDLSNDSRTIFDLRDRKSVV